MVLDRDIVTYYYYNHFMVLHFVQDNPCEPVPEETFTHSPLSRSSIIPYLLPPSITIRGILLVQFTWLTVFLHILQVFFGLPLGLAPSSSYSVHFFTRSSSSAAHAHIIATCVCVCVCVCVCLCNRSCCFFISELQLTLDTEKEENRLLCEQLQLTQVCILYLLT